jgi:serine/threonine protein kinase
MQLSDSVLDHLRRVSERPDFSTTRYELGEEIGRGGMGTVYAARDVILDRRVALKVLHAANLALDEARLAAKLEHPAIVPVYDAGTLPDGRGYYAMKLVQGQRLDQFLSMTPSLPLRLRAFQKICDAVAFAHSEGVIHRDLKPANIMTGPFGEVLTMDWGVARRADANQAPGNVAGTARYMAPEQAAGQPHDHRADIYALGAILTDLLDRSGSRPIAAVAAKAMAADPLARYPSALDLAADVERFLESLPVSAYRERLPERFLRFTTRNKTLMLLLSAYVLVRVLFLAARYF